jgi:hypothetical protein
MDFSIRPRERDKDRERERDRNRDLPRRRDDDAARPAKKHRHDGDRHAASGNGKGDAAVGSGGKTRRLGGARAVAFAKRHLFELTGRQPEAVSGLARTRDGWRVIIEIVELERIPQTTDILASYAVDIDNDGELIGYQRVNRYYRSDVSGDQ